MEKVFEVLSQDGVLPLVTIDDVNDSVPLARALSHAGLHMVEVGFRTGVDVMIATDCISEGQNLQDCDYLINYDIHWNPVRIIQRFGRIDRIGSKNKNIQLVNFWPDIELDEYLNLTQRVKNKMKQVMKSR